MKSTAFQFLPKYFSFPPTFDTELDYEHGKKIKAVLSGEAPLLLPGDVTSLCVPHADGVTFRKLSWMEATAPLQKWV